MTLEICGSDSKSLGLRNRENSKVLPLTEMEVVRRTVMDEVF